MSKTRLRLACGASAVPCPVGQRLTQHAMALSNDGNKQMELKRIRLYNLFMNYWTHVPHFWRAGLSDGREKGQEFLRYVWCMREYAFASKCKIISGQAVPAMQLTSG